jgi:hypothetical protein
MLVFARLYYCCKCRAQVIICRNCDHGNQYCAKGCSKKARKESLKRAAEKYLKTRKGKFGNAARQQAFRDRQKQKVTHQGSQQIPSCDVVKNPSEQSEINPKIENRPQGLSAITVVARVTRFYG